MAANIVSYYFVFLLWLWIQSTHLLVLWFLAFGSLASGLIKGIRNLTLAPFSRNIMIHYLEKYEENQVAHYSRDCKELGAMRIEMHLDLTTRQSRVTCALCKANW